MATIASLTAELEIVYPDMDGYLPDHHRNNLFNAMKLMRLQASQIAEAREALSNCLAWMEATRASGDCGNWDWSLDDEYSLGIKALQSLSDEREVV